MSEERLDLNLFKRWSDFNSFSLPESGEEHLNAMQKTLKNLLKYAADSKGIESFLEIVAHQLPIVQVQFDRECGQSLSLSLLCQAQSKISLSDFLIDLFRYHLIPAGENYPSSFQHLTFQFNEALDSPLYMAHLVVMIHNERELDLVEMNLPFVVETLKRGISSPKYAQSILNRQLAIPDQKGNQIHRYLLSAIKKCPMHEDLFINETSVFMSMAPDMLMWHRPSKLLTRLVCSLAWMRYLLRETSGLSAIQPRICFRIFPMTLQFTFGEKRTLGLCIGVSHLDDYQLFNEMSILHAARRHLPEVQTCKGSYLTYQHPQDATYVTYVELEKKKGEAFTLEEVKLLKSYLGQSLEASIEDLVPSVFMMSNEEEIMKNIMTLREELHVIDDPQQVIISFEGQTLSHLIYLVTLVRVIEQNTVSIDEQLTDLGEEWEFIPERKRLVSKECDEITKEAYVFRLRLQKSSTFMRTDSSVNLHLARQYVVDFLTKRLGPLRDYTGGIIVLQNALFAQFKAKFQEVANRYPNLLEDFFYGLSPADVQVTLPLSSIVQLFEHFLQLLKVSSDGAEGYVVKKGESGECVFAVLRLNSSFSDELDQKIRSNETLNLSLIATKVFFHEDTYLGYIYRDDSVHKRGAFFEQLQSHLLSLAQKEQTLQILRLDIEVFPTSLDPRMTLHSTSNQVLKLLFDGLMRIDVEGRPECAVAESYSLSSDRKTYTFNLRKSYWNNGDLVTAHDFAYAWKKVLSPGFDTPFAYLFYSIKNALAAKKGEVSLEEVGIYAVNEKELVVEIEHPVPHFLHYLALNVFVPVNRHVDRRHPDWPFRLRQEYVCNGPFVLDKAVKGKKLQLVKNPLYWDYQHVHLAQVHIGVAQGESMLKRFKKGHTDWLGAPFFTLCKKHFLQCRGEKHTLTNSSGTSIFVNTESHPFSNKKLRQALKSALNLEELVECLEVDARPALSPFPPMYSNMKSEDRKKARKQARALFHQALEEMHITASELPKMTLLHASESLGVRKKMLIRMQDQVKDILDIELYLEIMPWSQTYKKILEGNYQLFIVTWKSLCQTLFYLLDTFGSFEKYNFYKWSNKKFRALFLQAMQEEDVETQREKFAQLENILLEECPVIPLYLEEESYFKNERLKGVSVDHSQNVSVVDFKTAYFKSIDFESNPLIRWI